MNIKRILALGCAAAIAAGAMGGCGKKEEKSGDTVVLKYVMPGPGIQEDSEKVWKVFNTKLQEKLPNVRVDFEIIPISEYNQKFMLMCSAREKIDIANNYSLDFNNEVANGTFAPLDDLLNEYGKETLKALPEWFMDYQKIDGVTYGIPTYQMCAYLRGVCFFKEQAEKYLDMEAFKKALYKTEYFNEEVYDILEKYIEDMKADGLNFKNVTILNTKGLPGGLTSYFGVTEEDGKYKVAPTFINDKSKLRFSVARRWNEKGFFSEDVLSNNSASDWIGQIDGYPFWDAVYTPFAAEELSKKYGNEIIMIPYSETWTLSSTNTAAGTSIMQSCEHKEEAMQVLNLLQTDKELYNLLVFGIEGDHYTKTGEDSIQTEYDGQVTENNRYGLYKWIVGNTENAYNTQNEPPEYKDWVFNDVNKNGKKPVLMGFKLDTSPIQNYLTQIAAIQDKYLQPLNCGVLEDWEDSYNKYEQETMKVGGKQIMEYLQQQVDEFLGQ